MSSTFEFTIRVNIYYKSKKSLKVRFLKKIKKVFKKLGLGLGVSGLGLVVRVGVRVSVRCREFIIMINSKCAANLS
jgi:hypothetical protein